MGIDRYRRRHGRTRSPAASIQLECPPSRPSCLQSTMPGMLVLLSFLASLLLSCLCFPAVWASITGGDEFLDAHEAGLAVVASRESYIRPPRVPSPPQASWAEPPPLGTPFRESGPPACMAKLIMLRHKVSSLFLPHPARLPRPEAYSFPPFPAPCRVQLQQDNTRRSKGNSQARRASRTFNVSPSRPPRNVPWGVRMGRGKQNY